MGILLGLATNILNMLARVGRFAQSIHFISLTLAPDYSADLIGKAGRDPNRI